MNYVLLDRDRGWRKDVSAVDDAAAVESAREWVESTIDNAERIELGETDGRSIIQRVEVWRADDFERRWDLHLDPVEEIEVEIPLLYYQCGGGYVAEGDLDHDWALWSEHLHGAGMVGLAYCRRCGAEQRTDTWAPDGRGGYTQSLTVRPLALLDPDRRDKVREWLRELEEEFDEEAEVVE